MVQHNHSEWCRINKNITFEKTKSCCSAERTYNYSILSRMRIGNKDLHCFLCLLSGVLAQRYLCLGKIGQIFDHIETLLHKCPKIHLKKEKYIPQKRTLPPHPKMQQTNKQNKTTTSTPKPDENLGKGTLNLGAHIYNLELSLLSGELLRESRGTAPARALQTGWCGLHGCWAPGGVHYQEPFHRSSIWCEITAPAYMLWIWVFTLNFRQLFSVCFLIMNGCTKN